MNRPRKSKSDRQRRRILLTVGILLAVVVLIYLGFIAQGVLNS